MAGRWLLQRLGVWCSEGLKRDPQARQEIFSLEFLVLENFYEATLILDMKYPSSRVFPSRRRLLMGRVPRLQ